MSHIRQLSIPADNPEYFNSSRWTVDNDDQSSVMRSAGVVTNDIMVEQAPVQLMESIKMIDNMAAKEETKPRSKNRLGSSLKRLFRSASRRGSASEIEVDHSNNNSSSLPPVSHTNHYASLPSSPRHQSKARTQTSRVYCNDDIGGRLNNNKPPSGHNIPSLRSRLVVILNYSTVLEFLFN